MPCQKAWCASCYKVPEGSRFPISFLKDEDGNVLVNEEDKTMFLGARVEDHVVCPFQCELCHFRNMQGRSPMKGTGVLNDAETIDLIRRANIDAFWSREHTTIGHNLSKINRVLQISHELGLDKPPVPMLGTWPVEDKFGMGAAIVLLKHSLNHGVTETTVQYNAMRKMKSTFVNLYHASVENQGSAIVGGRDGKSFVSMDAPIYSEFLGRFQAGMHNRMGDKVVQDFGLSRGIMQKFQEVMEGEWMQADVLREIKMDISQLAVFVLVGYARALRGEEIPKLDNTGLLKKIAEGAQTTPKHSMLSLVGMFKQEDGERQHYLPVVAVTGSGLHIRDWIRRPLELKVKSGQTQGFLFRLKNGSPAKWADFDEPLIERLVWIQENTEVLIPMTIDLRGVFGCQITMRRGATTEALNVEVDASWIDANNGWRKNERAKGKMPSMSMRQLYTEMLQNLKHELKFSLAI
jgi:hypothetical protein